MRTIVPLAIWALCSCDRPAAPTVAPEPSGQPVVPTDAATPPGSSSGTLAPPRRPDAAAPVPIAASVERVAVPGDAPASLVRGAAGSRTHIVFLPGLCSNASGYLHAFPEAARAHGGIVAIDGDRPCGAADSGFRSFSWSPMQQRARIEAALAAASVDVPPDGLTLVGYSSGASIAELMHEQWPALFPRLVLIAPPKAPSLPRLANAKAVVTMACSLDVTSRMKVAASRLEQAGVPASYLEMPGCTHGNIADGERVFDEAFRWLDAHALPGDGPRNGG